MSGRSLFRIHSWIGVVAGLLLFVICWSGTMAVLANEIDWLLNPAIRAQTTSEPVDWGRIDSAVRAEFPEGTITGYFVPLAPGFAAQVGVDLPDHPYLRVYVDPVTAQVQGHTSYFNVQRFFRSFHMNLFSGTPGYYVVFVFSLFLLASLVLPFFFYKRWWRGFLKLERRRGARVFWSDFHKLSGLWSAAFALIIALTGVWYLVEALRVDVGDGKIAWLGTADHAVNVIAPLERAEGAASLPIGELATRVQAARPDLAIRSTWFEEGYLYVDGQDSHLLVRDRANKLYLDPVTGAILHAQRASDQPAYWRWSDTADPLHFGDFAGLASKLVWFSFGLALSGLALTGAWLHAQRIARDRAGKTRWRGVWIAYGATFAVLGAATMGGIAELVSYGPIVEGIQQKPEVPVPVAGLIIGWIALTIAILLAWVWLLSKRPDPAREDSLRASEGAHTTLSSTEQLVA